MRNERLVGKRWWLRSVAGDELGNRSATNQLNAGLVKKNI